MGAEKEKNKPNLSAGGHDGTPTPSGGISGVGNVEKIRDILFGAQMRDYERKFARLEERILKEVTRLREETTKRFEALENHINKEVESLIDGLKAEQTGRKELAEELSAELQKTAETFEKKRTKLEDQLGKSATDLGQQILDQSKTLSDDIRKKIDETMEALDQAARELRDEKVDRSTLADLLTEIALRLSNGSALGLDLDSEDLKIE